MKRAKEWDELEWEQVADYDVFKVSRHVARSPRTGEARPFHVLDVPSCVIAIPLTQDRRVVLVEQYRQAIRRVSLEFPAGVVEDGEPPLDAALRELEEETGFCAGSAAVLGTFDPDPAIQSNTVSVVVAEACEPSGQRNQDRGEDVEVRIVAVAEVAELIERGEIRSAPSITAWSLFQRWLNRT
jgi:ADP-ribose pyrophosphatase